MYDPRQNLIVALDVSSAAAAQKIVAAVGVSALTYKVGMQLYTAEGPNSSCKISVASGRRVFLDLKYHDIPTTVAAAVREAAELKVSMLTIHAAGGGKMIRAAVEAARNVNQSLMLLGVTVLTSMDDQDLDKVGVRGRVVDQAAASGGNGHHKRLSRRGRIRSGSRRTTFRAGEPFSDCDARGTPGRQRPRRSKPCGNASRSHRGRRDLHCGWPPPLPAAPNPS